MNAGIFPTVCVCVCVCVCLHVCATVRRNIPPLCVCHRAWSPTEVCSSSFYSARQ